MGIPADSLAAATHVNIQASQASKYKALCSKPGLLKVSNSLNRMSSARLPVQFLILFNNCMLSEYTSFYKSRK